MSTGIEEFTSAFFDEASAAWRRNKVALSEGMFRYKKNAFPERELKAVEKPKKEEKPRRSARLAAKKVSQRVLKWERPQTRAVVSKAVSKTV